MPAVRVFFVVILSLIYSCLVLGQQSTGRSVAITLKLNGNTNTITGTGAVNTTIYEGTAKQLNNHRPANASAVLKIKVTDTNSKIIYEGYYENPLNQHLESFEENGTITNNRVPTGTGYINLRFPIGEALQDITISCYTLRGDIETVASTLDLKIQ